MTTPASSFHKPKQAAVRTTDPARASSEATPNDRAELTHIENDLAASFEQFRAVEPGTYLAATPAASTLAAAQFVHRLAAYFAQNTQRKVEATRLETKMMVYKGWLNWVESGGGHVDRHRIREEMSDLEAELTALQEGGKSDG